MTNFASEMTTEEWLRDYIIAEAAARQQSHSAHSSQRPLSNGYDVVGLAGEFEFGRMFGLMPDLTAKAGGDSGVDFLLPLKFAVDVKTFRKAKNLIHEQKKKFADVFVLAEYDDVTSRAQLLGWEWGARLKAAPIKDFGYGVLNHHISANELRPMAELLSRVWGR